MRREVLSEYVRRTNLLLMRLFSRDPRFTARERQIIDFLRQGWSNKQIANALDISERTAKFHVSNVLRKCNMGTRGDFLMENRKNLTPPTMLHFMNSAEDIFSAGKAAPVFTVKKKVSQFGAG